MAAVTRLGLYGGPRAVFGASVPTDVQVHPPGMAPDANLRRKIQEDDELLLVVIMAFLQIKDE